MAQDESTCILEGQQNLLIVEDSKTFASLLQRTVRRELGLEPTVLKSYAEARSHLASCSQAYFAALLDLNLPDAQRGEIVDLVAETGLPAIVFTAEISDGVRELMWSRRIVDYVLKENLDSVQQVVDAIRRLKLNLGQKVLVADDSPTSRKLIRDLLEVWNFTVLEAADGLEALEVLQREKNVKLLVTDYNMPRMDGVALVREARRTLSKSRLPIIGLSGAGGATTSAHFIKAGANDYMHKPFLTEELYCRVLHNIENSEYIATIRNMAERDFLTGLYNRRFFFNYGHKRFDEHTKRGGPFAVLMLDIDHFKRCNDTYGHDAGDTVIKAVAQRLQETFPEPHVVARFGGEEYCVACSQCPPGELQQRCEELRRAIEQTAIRHQEAEIAITVSMGLFQTPGASLEAMITSADNLLYAAKQGGRNRLEAR